jgi:hypothetical protein
MYCKNGEPNPKVSFALFATPKQAGFGRWVYCAEADGHIRVAKRHRDNYCLSEGVRVPE